MEIKKNIEKFNEDVERNEGYRYTTNAPYSSRVANLRQTQAVLERIPKTVQTIVDVGSGDGAYTREIQQAFPQARVSGFDPAEEAVAVARKRYPEIDFYVADLLKAESLPKTRYDVAVVRGVLHHVADQLLAIKNCVRLANKVIFLEPNGNNPILKVIEKVSPYHRQHEEQSFSSRTLRKWYTKARCKILSMDYFGFVPFFCPTLLAKLIYWIQPFLEKIPVLTHIFAASNISVCQTDDQK